MATDFFRGARRGFHRKFLLGIGLFLASFALSTTFWLLNDYLRYDPADPASLDYFLHWRAANLLIFVSLFFLVYSLEDLVLRRVRHVFSALMLTNIPLFLFAPAAGIALEVAGIAFISPFSLPLSIYFVLALNLGILVMFLIYLRLGAITTGEVRVRSWAVGLGILLVWMGRMAAYREIAVGGIPEEVEMILGPLLMVAGFYALHYGFWKLLHAAPESPGA
jgi:hypothetical protein